VQLNTKVVDLLTTRKKNEIKEYILSEELNGNANYEIPILLLLDDRTTIRFVEKHFIDLREILKLSSSPHKPEQS